MNSDDNARELLRQLELQHRSIVDAPAGKPIKLDHPVRLLYVKLYWKLSHGGAARSVKFGINKRKLAYFTAPPLLVFLLFFAYSVFLPENINYNFADKNHCTSSPLLLPGLFARTSSGNFNLNRSGFRLLGIDVYSGSVCAKAEASPSAKTAYADSEWLNLFGLKLQKNISVKTSSYVLANAPKLGASAIPIEKPLSINLAGQDQTFSYALGANNQLAPCTKSGETLDCNLAPLKLAYGTGYSLSVDRLFNGKIAGTLLTKNMQTITATGISDTSIGASTTVYNKPQSLTIATTKNLSSVGSLSLSYNSGGKSVLVPIKTSFKANQINVSWSDVLPRQTSFDLHLAQVTAVDDSELEQPYDLVFTTSGGPAVSGSNIPSFGLNSGQPLTLVFNQQLDPNQSAASLASLIVNGQAVAATASLSGNRIVVTPPSGYAYPVCASVRVVLSANVESNYDVSGNSAYSYTTRSHCYTTYSIGTSVLGRPITAYQFGSNPGSNMVLFIAAMEGNEQNSANLLTQWLPDVDANPGKIPAGRTIVIIPQINPDGYAADTRLNAAGTDLNRNFPANNWSEQVTEPLAGNTWTNDGGPYPLSAPESQALANFYQTYKPMLAITEHSHGGIVEANDAGDSIALGSEYAKLAGYRAIPTSLIGNFFAYTTTGAFEDWANDKLGLPVLEIELQSPTNDEYSRNLPALWAMAQIPAN